MGRYELEPVDAARQDALTLLKQHEAAIAHIAEVADAEALWRRVSALERAAQLARVSKELARAMQRVRLRAERRWGELLPDPRPGERTDLAQPAQGCRPERDKDAERRARQVAAVPQRVFDTYVNDDSADDLSRAGLLRAAEEQARRDFERERLQMREQLRIASPVPRLGVPGRDPRLLARAPDRQLPLCVRVGATEELWMAKCPHCGRDLVG